MRGMNDPVKTGVGMGLSGRIGVGKHKAHNHTTSFRDMAGCDMKTLVLNRKVGAVLIGIFMALD